MSQLTIIVDYLHSPAAEDIAGPYQHRESDKLSYLEGFVNRGYCCPRRLGDAQLAEEVLKALSVFS